ncbi:hypothetical protein HB364_26345 [Pseudoflavitalea sp. X16]|uniref:hypothetical protein n=1 Tax=Paraflavitalea devenefica TaxID=2716334 RepID=UPI00141E958F|nr:hypothetical protein [Paraflavitalea devenefica]NII28632.1 hypothetical protein [Paraflavitalea devenefica]
MFSTIRPASLRSKNLYTTAILLCILFLSGQAWSQTSYQIELKVVAYGNNYWDGNSNGARYRLFRESYYGSDQWYNLLYSCLTSNANSVVYPNYTLYTFLVDVNAPRQFRIRLGTHHERKDGSDNCTSQGTSDVSFKHPDLWDMEQVFTFDFTNIQPGVFTALPRMNNYNGPTSWVDLQVRYSILRPDMPVLKNADQLGLNICPNQLLTLKTKNNNFNQAGIKYKWEYLVSNEFWTEPNPEYCGPPDPMMGCGRWIETYGYDQWGNWGLIWVWESSNCCNLPPVIIHGTWHPLTNTLPYNSPYADSIVFNPMADVFQNVHDGTTKTVYFRVKAYNEVESYWSDVMSISVAGPPPSLPEVPLSLPSCPGSATGSISLANIAGVGAYSYILNAGFDNVSTYCDPANQNCIGFSVRSGNFSGTSLNLTNLPAGEYTLIVANPGGGYGACYAYQNIKIDSFPPVKLGVDAYSRTVSCFGAQDGYVNLSSTGGNRSSLTYSITNTLTSATSINYTGQFTSLAPGNYQVKVTDFCNQSSAELIVIGEPTRVDATPIVSQPTCVSPINGKLSVTARRGGGVYNYLLTSYGVTIASHNDTRDTVWEVPQLIAGNYVLSILDAERTGCAGYQYSFDINNVTPLALSLVSNTPITCYGAGNGQLQFTATGGQSAYRFYLVNSTSLETFFSASGSFVNIPAGTYTAYVKNADLNCTDSMIWSTPVTVTQPNDVQYTFTIQHAICKGNNNGAITLNAITGGTGSFSYTWQQKLNDSWFDYTANGQGSGASLTNLHAGTFRLKTVDAQQCNSYSGELVVREPDYDLILSNVMVTDIKCLNGAGSIVPVAAGGYGAYTYIFTPSGGSPTPYNPQTYAFGPGTYTVKVRDSLGCELVHPDPVTITSPPSALSFTITLLNYNGYHVSCYGNLNGRITVNATGGNGGNYAGYEYALSPNGPWQTSNVFDSLGAGAKTVYVKDGRGCVVSQNVTLTQPASVITANTTYTNAICSTDSSGNITITASGGVPPYQYKVVRTGTTGGWWENYQSSPVFNNLPWGQYTVTVKDANGCTRVTTRLLTYKSTGPVLAVTKQDITCFNANTGSIAVTVTSGINKVTPYTYTWTGVSASTSAVSSLMAGVYRVRVADSLGCRKDSVILLTQPYKIQTNVSARPICIGSSDGRITFAVSGGVSPYTYSINNGTSYQPSVEFSNLTAGNYLVKVKDANNCTDTMTVPVVTRNMSNTYVNFLVSSKQNAFDTVVAKEVCSPRPDSVKWEFAPGTVVVDDNQFSPRIRFNSAGSFAIKMTPYFGGCDLPMTKNVQIKPFDSTIVYNNPNIVGIDTVLVMPNPNTGQFSLQVKLFRQQRLDVYVRTITGTLLYYRHWNSVKEVMETINLNNNGTLPAGTYFLKILTDNDARDLLIIKQ